VLSHKDSDPHHDLQSQLLRLDERVLELTERLENAVGKLVSLAQLVRESTSSHAALSARLEQLQQQLDAGAAVPQPVYEPAAVMPAPENVPERAPQPVQEPDFEPAPVQEPDFGQVVGLLRAGDSNQARRALGRIPASVLHEQPVLHSLTEAALNAQTGDISAALASLEQAQSLCGDPRLAQALQMAQKMQEQKD
jgi:hypothetical protein